MAAFAIVLSQNVEKKWFHIIIERLVVQEELSKEAEVLAIDLACHAVHFKDGKIFMTINLVGRRVKPVALCPVSFQDGPTLHILETKLTKEELWEHGILLGVRGRVPRLYLVLSKLDHGG